MKKSLIISAAAAAALAVSASARAADIVTYQQPAAAPPAAEEAINWTGLYAGAGIGGSWGDSRTSMRAGPGGYGQEGGKGKLSKSLTPDSFIGGLFAGYNFQVPMINNAAGFMRGVVFGVETDFFWNSGGTEGSRDYGVTGERMKGGADAAYNYRYHANVRELWNGSTDLRVGYAFGPQNRFMPYFRTGVSYANIHARGQVASHGDDGTSGFGGGGRTDTRAGWNIGGGLDYVPPILNNHIILRAEYRFTDFGAGRMARSTYYDLGHDVNAPQSQHVHYRQNDFRVGVAYKF